MTVLLSSLKLMQNALGAGLGFFLSLMCTFAIRVCADVSQSRNITFFGSAEKIKQQRVTQTVPAKFCQSQTWLCSADCPWVLRMCQRYGVTAGDALNFSQWNLSSTWDSRLESDNHHWLVTSMFSLNVPPFKGTDTKPPIELRILKIIYEIALFVRVCDSKHAAECRLLMCGDLAAATAL